MNDLIRPSRVAEILQKHNLRPHKGLGQNFLVDAHALQRIVAAAEVGAQEVVIEIGPGLGTLTRELASRARRVIAIEKDKKLTPVLAETLSGCNNVRVVFADACEVNWASLLDAEPPPYKVVANLPYYVTTPLIMALLESKLPWTRLVFLVQQEVAWRMQAQAGTPEFGALSLAVQYYAEVAVKSIIPPTAFFPPPRVSSAVVALEVRADPASCFGLRDERVLFRLIRAAFNQRRKTLANSLTAGGFERSAVLAALGACGIPPVTRGEKLDLTTFVALANALLRVEGGDGDVHESD